jgi:hypothetical protein
MVMSRCSTRPRHLRVAFLLGVPVMAWGLASCSPTVLPLTTLWSADVRPSSPGAGGIRGTLGVVAEPDRTTASMQLTGGEPGVTYLWRMSVGDCTSEGALLGGHAVYQVLVPADNGIANGDAAFSEHLEAEGSYAARILQDAGNGEVTLGCGELTRTK